MVITLEFRDVLLSMQLGQVQFQRGREKYMVVETFVHLFILFSSYRYFHISH